MASTPPSPRTAWFCLRARPKHEHIAARHLRQVEGLEVFLPRIRFRRKTRQGVVWVTEALFPNYLFVRFDWQNLLRRVHHAPGVAGVIHFGERWPTIPDDVLDELRRLFGQQELHVLTGEPEVGERVQITDGVFRGLQAVVAHVLPARQRVAVLLDFLGRQTTVELSQDQVLRAGNVRSQMRWKPGQTEGPRLRAEDC